jgi:hypothetical protein
MLTDPRNDGIKLTQYGQSRPYASSIYVGTVSADSEESAKEKLAAMRRVNSILTKQDRGQDWSMPYFEKLSKTADNNWEFVIVEEYTG